MVLPLLLIPILSSIGLLLIGCCKRLRKQNVVLENDEGRLLDRPDEKDFQNPVKSQLNKEADEKDPLNASWTLHQYPLTNDFERRKKIWIMGRYKIGKSSILRWLGVEAAEPANLINTKGEVFITDPNWPNEVFIDTEGFEQPIGTTEPEFRKHFILKHAHLSANMIILVIPQILIDDLKLFMKNVKFLARTRLELVIVHNLMIFDKENEIDEYSQILYKYLTNSGILSRINGKVLISNHGDADVQHYFLGNHENKQVNIRNQEQLSRIKIKIEHIGGAARPFFKGIIDSLKVIGSIAYSFQMQGSQDMKTNLVECLYDQKSNPISIKFNKKIMSTKMRQIGDNILFGNNIDYQWLEPVTRFVDGKDIPHQPLLIGLNKIEKDSVRLIIRDEVTIEIRVIQISCNHLNEIVSKIETVEIVNCECSIDRYQTIDSPKHLDTGEICYLIKMN